MLYNRFADCNCFYKIKHLISSINKLPSIILINVIIIDDNFKYESYIAEKNDSSIFIDTEN